VSHGRIKAEQFWSELRELWEAADKPPLKSLARIDLADIVNGGSTPSNSG
jgi:hypothetical protein